MTSAVATPARVRTRSRALAIHPDLLAGGAAALFALVLLAATWGTWGNLNQDTGYDAVAGARLADGELPYVDFLYYYGPLGPALAALAVLVGGDGFGSQVGLGLAITALILAGTYLLARKLVRPARRLPGDRAGHGRRVHPGELLVRPAAHHRGDARHAAAARAAARGGAGRGRSRGSRLAARRRRGRRPQHADEARVRARGGRRRRRLARRAAARQRGAVARRGVVAVPAAVIPLVVYGPFALATGVGDLLFENLYPVDTMNNGGDAIVRARMPLTVSSIAELGVRFALYAAGVAALVIVAKLIARGGRGRVAGVVLLVLGALALAAVAVANPEALRHGLQFIYGWVPLGAAAGAVWIVLRERRAASPWSADAQLTFASTVVLAVLAIPQYHGFFLHSENSQAVVYYAPFVAVLLARLHLVELARGRAAVLVGAAWLLFLVVAGAELTLSDANGESRTVHGPGGSITAPASDAAAFQGAVDAIAANTRPGEPILAAPFLTSLYVLSRSARPGLRDRAAARHVPHCC